MGRDGGRGEGGRGGGEEGRRGRGRRGGGWEEERITENGGRRGMSGMGANSRPRQIMLFSFMLIFCPLFFLSSPLFFLYALNISGICSH